MLGLDDERSSERMNFRVKPRVKSAIRHAAALSGVDESAFTLDAAYRAALATIDSHERTVLKPVDYEAFFEALDNPAEPTARMKAAAEDYHRTVIRR